MKIFNKSNLRFLMLPFAMMLAIFTYGQNVVVTLSKDNSMVKQDAQQKQECYKIQIKNKSSKAVGLAGQNYRLYYNSNAVILDEEHIQSYLPETYTSMKVVQHVFDVDATGFGILPFESHLGFINLATDFKLSTAGPVSIGSGESVNVAGLCFNISDETLDSGLTWAKEDLTQTYATAFVEIAALEGNKLKKMHIDDLVVQGTTTSTWQQESVATLDFFPNPFTDQLGINFNHALEADAQLDVMDVFGRIFQTMELKKGTEKVSIKGADLPDGAILVKIRQQNGDIATFKAIKIK